MLLTQERLQEVLSYDPETGEFVWAKTVGPRAKAGRSAGYVNSYGYRMIGFDGKYRYAHRLAWLYMTGRYPENEIDHRNKDKLDNRWVNLREATSRQNAMNRKMRKDNRTGLKGVGFDRRRGKYTASITHNGRVCFLGLFNNPEEAHAAYVENAKLLYGEFACTA
jgi:hypothetical protein